MTVDRIKNLGKRLPASTFKLCACVLLVFVANESRAELFRGRRLSSFSVPRQQFFFNGPQRFNSGFNGVNQFNGFNGVNQFNQFNNTGFNQFSGNGSFFNNNNLVDPRQAVQINGFSKIKQLGNDIIEVDQFGIGQKLFIDRNGDLIGGAKPPEARTVEQLKEFYLNNRDKFNGNAKVLVDRFLQKQGALSNGLFKIDLDDFALNFADTEVLDTLNKRFNGNKAAMRRELGLAALNYLLNSLQLRTKIRIPPQSIAADGTVTLNLAPFFRGEVLAQLSLADSTTACTGKTRLNRLIDFTMNAENYAKILKMPKTEQELARDLGLEYDKTLTFQNKIIVGPDKDGNQESLPTKTDQRVLEIQTPRNIPGGTCYRSYDQFDQFTGGESANSRNIKTEGINFSYDGTEGLCLGSNGFMFGYLANAAGTRLDRAPGSIASGGILGPEIKSVISCLDCHADGFLGGSISKRTLKPFTEHFGDVPNRPTVFRDSFGRLLNHRDFFTTNPVYAARAKRDSEIFRAARIQTGSEFLNAKGEPFAVLPQIARGFNGSLANEANLTPANVAVELGLGDSPQAAAQAERLMGQKKISRSDFEGKFCNLLGGKNDFLNEIQDQGKLRNEQILNGGGFQNPNHFGR